MTMTLNTLDDLLKSLEKQASEDESAKKEEDKKEDEKKSDEAKGKEMPWDKKDDSEKKEDRVKEAQLQGAALADQIMQKVASANLPTQKETSMNTAQFAGQALAQSLLEKLASAGDMTTTNGVFAGALPNKAQIDNAQMTAEQDAIIAPTPTKDGMGNGGGSVNQIFDAIVAKAMAQGAVAHDQVTQTGIAPMEGAVEQHAVPNGVPSTSDSVEKVAAVSALVNSGFDFDQAVEMVKAAEYEIQAEEEGQIKQAAMNELLDAGVDFALAAALVKSAAEEGQKATMGRGLRAAGRSMVEGAVGGVAGLGAGAGLGALAAKALRKNPAAGASMGAALGSTIGQAVGSVHGIGRSVQNQMSEKRAGLPIPATTVKIVKPSMADAAKAYVGAHKGAIAGGMAAGGAAGYAAGRAQEKQAALNGLIDAGMDFDTAAALVAETAQELYGA